MTVVSLILLSLSSGIVVFFATINGPWGYSDSVAYIVTARNVIKGLGLGMFTPSGRFVVTHLHPPLYPLLLSGIGIWGVDLVDAARWCNIVLCVLTVFLLGIIFLRHTHRSDISILAGALTVFFPTALMMFTSSMSEPLFLFLFSLGSLLLFNYLRRQTPVNFWASALLFGTLPVTRYIGIAVVFSAVVCIFLFSAGTWQQRAKRTFLFGLLTGVPLLVWLVALYWGQGYTLAGRSVEVDGQQLTNSFDVYKTTATQVLWSWIPFSARIPSRIFDLIRYAALVIAPLVIICVTWIAGRRLTKKDKTSDAQLPVFFGLVALFYFLVFTASWLFTVPQTPINDRLLLPIYFGVMLGFLGCWAIWQKAWLSSTFSPVRTIPLLLIFLVMYWYYPQLARTVRLSRENDTIITYRFRDSQTMRAVASLPADQPVISSDPDAVLMWADRPAYDLMKNLDADFMKQSLPYGSDETDTAQKIFQKGAALVVFNDFPRQFEVTFGKLGRERSSTIFDGLILVGQYTDGAIYIYPGK